MSLLNPGYPTRRPKSSAHFGADASAPSSSDSSNLPATLLIGGLVVFFGLMVVNDMVSPDPYSAPKE